MNHSNHQHHNYHHKNSHNDHNGHSMMMYMHGGLGSDYVIFKEWNPRTTTALAATCLVIFIISILYEALKSFREILDHKNFFQSKSSVRDNSNIEMKANNKTSPSSIFSGQTRYESYFGSILNIHHIVHTLLYVLQFIISYFLMLSFMTYNYWICLSIIIGIAVGFFLFGAKRNSSKINLTCH